MRPGAPISYMYNASDTEDAAAARRSCSSPPGTTVGFGSSLTVTCTATDSGNHSTSASLTFTVRHDAAVI